MIRGGGDLYLDYFVTDQIPLKMSYYPKRPLRCFFITFGVLLGMMVAGIIADQRLRQVWALAILYPALLAFVTIGLIRLGKRAWRWLAISSTIALLPGIVGMIMIFTASGSTDRGAGWLRLSVWLFYAGGAWILWLALKGWRLYYAVPATSRPKQQE